MSGDYVDPRVIRTRRAVSQAASELLLADGPDAVTHARLSDITTYSRTTLYKHFPERSDLLRAAMDQIESHGPPTDELTGDARSDLALLLGQLARDLGDPARSRLMITMLERAQHDASVAAVRDQVMAEMEPAFDASFRAAIDAGTLRGDLDTRMAIAALIGSLLFLRFLADDQITSDLVQRIIDDFMAVNSPRC
jgi:AcrR family transcriptional regulator